LLARGNRITRQKQIDRELPSGFKINNK